MTKLDMYKFSQPSLKNSRVEIRLSAKGQWRRFTFHGVTKETYKAHENFILAETPSAWIKGIKRMKKMKEGCQMI